MSNKGSLAEEIKALELDTISAQKWASEGKIEAWVHHYLLSGKGGRSNPAFSEGLNLEKRWWNGPIELSLTALSPAVGTEPGMEYVVNEEEWRARTSHLARSLSDPLSLPPMIAEYRRGELSLRDGNTRYGALKLLGWPTCWVIIWYNCEDDYQRHNKTLFGHQAVQESL